MPSPIPLAELYTRMSAWQVDSWQPWGVWHWTPDWRASAPFACGKASGGQPEWGPMDERPVCPACLAAGVPQ